MGIGSKRDVNAERILFFIDKAVCVYPAQSFDTFKYGDKEWTESDWYKRLIGGDAPPYAIQRNEEDYFGGGNPEERFVTYFAPIEPGSVG